MAASGADDERTVVSSPTPTETPPKKRGPWPLVALAGCAGVLCLALVVLVAVLLISDGGAFPIRLVSTRETPTTEVVDTPTAWEMTSSGRCGGRGRPCGPAPMVAG